MRRLYRRSTLGLLVLLLQATAGAGCRGRPQPSPAARSLRAALPVAPDCNVLVVSFDALRRDALGMYGNPHATSPSLDRFGLRAVIFDRAYTVAPVTPTSFAASFTGQLPTRSFRAWRLTAAPTLAESFQTAGYDTAAFVNQAQLSPLRGFGKGFDIYDWTASGSDSETLGRAMAWLDAPRRRPFFSWIHLLAPHAPYEYREIARFLYDPGYRGPFTTTSGAQFAPTGSADLARLRSLYEGNVVYADSLFERLLAHLERGDLLGRTVVVVTSDHGEEFGEHGGFQHGRLSEEHVRIPLLLFHPRRASGLRSDVLVANLDLLPTLLALVGHPVVAPPDGTNLLGDSGERRTLVGIAMTDSVERSVSLRSGDWKLVLRCRPKPGAELYDLALDPGERDDRSAADRDAVQRMSEELATTLGDAPCRALDRAVAGGDPRSTLDPESEKALRALGYL